jgi:hypothetical protein
MIQVVTLERDGKGQQDVQQKEESIAGVRSSQRARPRLKSRVNMAVALRSNLQCVFIAANRRLVHGLRPIA